MPETILPTSVIIPVHPLKLYEDLCALAATGFSMPSSWRDCAGRLNELAAACHPAFRAKYAARALDCQDRAERLERGVRDAEWRAPSHGQRQAIPVGRMGLVGGGR